MRAEVLLVGKILSTYPHAREKRDLSESLLTHVSTNSYRNHGT